MDHNPRRQSAGRINVLRRWQPDADEVVAYDIEAICAIAERIARPLRAAEAARVLGALGLAATAVQATVTGACPHGADVDDDGWTPCQQCTPIAS
jgi:hypothetical protein